MTYYFCRVRDWGPGHLMAAKTGEPTLCGIKKHFGRMVVDDLERWIRGENNCRTCVRILQARIEREQST